MKSVFAFLSIVFIILFLRCSSGISTNKYPKDKQETQLVQNTSIHIARDTSVWYDSILTSLSKNYILNVVGNNKQLLLDFYHKSEVDFLKYSAEYSWAVNSFYSSPLSIVYYLLKFEGDTTLCFWIFSKNPLSSNIKKWEFEFSKQQGATVLIYDYLTWNNSKKKKITTDPGEIEKIITDINLYKIKQWIEKKEGWPLDKLRKDFIVEFPPASATNR
jgi:hypothetical protein